MAKVGKALDEFNSSGDEPFRLHAAMGYARYGTDDDPETFLRHMDKKMYEEKRRSHEAKA